MGLPLMLMPVAYIRESRTAGFFKRRLCLCSACSAIPVGPPYK